MPDIVLSQRQQDDLRRLLSLEATPGSLPPGVVLELVAGLIPSDSVEIGLGDSAGYLVQQQVLSSSAHAADDPHVCDGPLTLGLVHQGRDPEERDMLHQLGLVDGLRLGFRSGPDHVVQLALERRWRPYSGSEVAMLRMISPALQRLMRTLPTVGLPASLTMTERRVLQLLATGRSNADIAEDLYVSVATVRKHLEHAYRKLGVHSRMAAVVAFGGGSALRDEHEELVDEYA